MITELSAQNFKSWAKTGKIQFAPLTGFFGANNSGKTSLLQTLLLFKQTVGRPQADQWDDAVGVDNGRLYPSNWIEPLYFGGDGSLVNLGDFDTVIHGHKADLSIIFFVSWKGTQRHRIGEHLTDTFSFSTSIVESRGNSELKSFCYTAGENRFGIAREDDFNGFMYKDNNGSWQALTPFRCYGITEPTEDLLPFLNLRRAFENLFSQIRHLGPLRQYPQNSYDWEGDHPESVGQQGERMVPALLAGRVRLLSIDEQIPKWLKEFKLIDSYDLHPVTDAGGEYEFLVKQHEGGPEVRLADVGFGVSQILPVLVSCYSAPENSILILEQPEAHLHPKVQSELADVLIDVVKTRKVQIILESHSEHLLHRLQRRIAEEKIAADDTALYFCEINEGTSEIERLDVDEYGNILNYPPDFFGDDLGDLVAKTEAEMKRREVME